MKRSVCIAVNCDPLIDFKAETAVIIKQPVAMYDKKEFIDIYKENIQSDGKMLLFKSVRDDGMDFYTGKIEYKGMVEPVKWDPSLNRPCGDGLHLSPTPQLAMSYNRGVIKKCAVSIDDFVVYPYDITKVRCRKVQVL